MRSTIALAALALVSNINAIPLASPGPAEAHAHADLAHVERSIPGAALVGSVKDTTNVYANSYTSTVTKVDAVAALKARGELKAFVDLLVVVASRAKYTSTLDAGIFTGLTTKLKLDAFSKWSKGICVDACRQNDLCGELSTYLTASFYAHLTGTVGTQLFAALGATRVDRFHAVIDGICALPNAHHESCINIWAYFDAWVAAAAHFDGNLAVATGEQFNSYGLFTSIDAFAHLALKGTGSAHVARTDSHTPEARLLGTGHGHDNGNIVGSLNAAASSLTKLKIDQYGIRLGSVTGVAANGFLLIDGILASDVLAKYGLKLDDKTFLSIHNGWVYLASSTQAAVNGATGLKIDKRLVGLGEAVAGVKAKVDAVVGATGALAIDKNGLRLGAITGIASDGSLLVNGKLLSQVLALAKIDLKSYTDAVLRVGKDGLYLFASSGTATTLDAITAGALHLRDRDLAALGKGKSQVDAISATGASVNKNGLFLGTVTGISSDGILLIDGRLLPDVLAAYGIVLTNENYLRVDKSGLYYYGATSTKGWAGASVKGKRNVGKVSSAAGVVIEGDAFDDIKLHA